MDCKLQASAARMEAPVEKSLHCKLIIWSAGCPKNCPLCKSELLDEDLLWLKN